MEKARRLVFLDGMRGIAALFVMARHAPELFGGTPPFRSYMAVDFFFILSGFIIGAAYDHQVESGRMDWKRFLSLRLVRLYPLYLVALVAAFLSFVVFTPPAGASALNAGVCAALNAVYIPCHFGSGEDLFTLNGPYWSLMFELLFNALYVFDRGWLTLKRHILVVAGFASILVVGGAITAKMDFGPYFTLRSFAFGFFRAGFGIYGGLLLFRLRGLPVLDFARRTPPWLAVACLVFVLATPEMPRWPEAAFSIFAVLVILPAIVLAGAKGQSRLDGWLLLLGAASYPFYLFHLSILRIWRGVTPHWPNHGGFPAGLALMAVMIPAMAAIEIFLDTPLRRALSKRLVPRPVTLTVPGE